MLQVQGSPASCPLPVPGLQNSSSWRPGCQQAVCPPPPPCHPPPPCSEEESAIPCPAAHSLAACTSSRDNCKEDQSENQTGGGECLSRYKIISAEACRCQQSPLSSTFFVIIIKSISLSEKVSLLPPGATPPKLALVAAQFSSPRISV